MSAKIRAMIVDDEQLAIDLVAAYLQVFPEIAVVAACSSSREAFQQITELKPELLFLDVKMPVMNGFQLIEALDPALRPWVIFTTAYDSFALKAFDIHAIGYLLKPFEQDKFNTVVQHFLAEYGERNKALLYEKLEQLLHSTQATASRAQRILVREKQRIFYVPVREIICFEAAGDYVKLILPGGKSHLVSDSLSALEQKLDPALFIRVHRSAMINTEEVAEFIPCNNGEYNIVMSNRETVRSSRNYRDNLKQAFPGL